MKSLITRFLVIVAVTLVCVWALFPLDKAIHLGKDLRGGVSMLYAVELPEGAANQQVLAQVIDSLKRRVNPQGVLDISFQPQGRDRIEIVMPLPGPEVKALQDAYRAQLASSAARYEVTPRLLDAALNAGTAANLAPAPAVGADSDVKSRRAALERLQLSVDAERDAKSAYVDALGRGATPEELAPIEEQIAQSQLSAQGLRAAVLASSVSASRLERALQLDRVGLPKKDAKGRTERDADGKAILQTPARQSEVDALRVQVPDLANELDLLITAYDAYAAVVTGYDDPEDLKRLLRASGVLEFHIPVNAGDPQGVNVESLTKQLLDRGAEATESPVARWYPINDLRQWYESPSDLEALLANPTTYFSSTRSMVASSREGRIYILLYTTDQMSMTHGGDRPWSMKQATATRDEIGAPAVSFRLDQNGGIAMARLTGANVGRPMAIVLDNEVYTAPTLQSQIPGSGQITGRFTNEDISYLIRVLEGGELEAKLSEEPVSVSILGPTVGADNLSRGLKAVFYSVIATAVIMLLYYLSLGVIADICLALNAALIFGVMAAIEGSFSLPGLAGVALSIGIAVDSNVLIFERIREEIVNNGENLRNAIKIGYTRAFSAILDGNITNLIVCIVLYKTAATEVKGFALTLAIGVVTTLFTALYVSRWMFDLLTEKFGVRSLPMMTTQFPAIGRMLVPSIDWFRIRWPIWIGCIGLSLSSVVLVASVGSDMLETEFRGGLSMRLTTRDAVAGEAAGSNGRLLIAREEVERRVRELGSSVSDVRGVRELASASILTVGETDSEFRSSSFQIKVGNPADLEDGETVATQVSDAVAAQFDDVIDITMPSEFNGRDVQDGGAFTRPITSALLGDATGDAAHTMNVTDFQGGVAILVDGITPALSDAGITARIARMRSQPDYSALAGREFEVIGLTQVAGGTPEAPLYSSVAVLVVDPKVLLEKVDAATWDRAVAQPEWDLVRASLGQKVSLDQVSSFSPEVARNLLASAVVAVTLSVIGMLLYIWLRFSSFRYSIATLTALGFNLTICLGMLALSVKMAGSPLAQSMLIESFRIDLNVIAGLLTIIGYSLNDTIVILDRVRENRGRLLYADASCINTAINQTFSRTLLTGGSTLATACILYWLGGTGIRPFAFTFVFGLLAGTASSIIIAAPMCRGKASPIEPEVISEIPHSAIRQGI
ncbi:MAG: protein translocase subunit SecD [Planctomycetota bacterium]|nr:protein translocase subunit SecD [Planctomycetota bacterium]